MESWLKSGEASISHTKLTTDQRPYQWLTGVDQGFLFFQSLFWASWKWNTWCYNLPVRFSIKESPTSYPSANCRPGISLHFFTLQSIKQAVLSIWQPCCSQLELNIKEIKAQDLAWCFVWSGIVEHKKSGIVKLGFIPFSSNSVLLVWHVLVLGM